MLGFKSRYLRAEIPNRYVADYCSRSPEKLIGFAGIDPTERTAVMELKLAHEELKLARRDVFAGEPGFSSDRHPCDEGLRAGRRTRHADPVSSRRPVHRGEQARICPAISAG